MWPQITLLTIMAIGLGSSMDGGRKFVVQLLGSSITIGLLYAGGFFTVLGWAP